MKVFVHWAQGVSIISSVHHTTPRAAVTEAVIAAFLSHAGKLTPNFRNRCKSQESTWVLPYTNLERDLKMQAQNFPPIPCQFNSGLLCQSKHVQRSTAAWNLLGPLSNNKMCPAFQSLSLLFTPGTCWAEEFLEQPWKPLGKGTQPHSRPLISEPKERTPVVRACLHKIQVQEDLQTGVVLYSLQFKQEGAGNV